MATIKTEVDIDFYCSECGEPICHCANQRNSNRTIIDMDMCPKCKERYERQIEELNEKIEALENQLERKSNG